MDTTGSVAPRTVGGTATRQTVRLQEKEDKWTDQTEDERTRRTENRRREVTTETGTKNKKQEDPEDVPKTVIFK